MRLILVGCLIVVMAACTPPGAQPTRSPLAGSFVSPLPTPGLASSPLAAPWRVFGLPEALPMQRTYLPLAGSPPPRIGVGMSNNHPDCSYLSAVNAEWYYDWTPEPLQCQNAQGIPMIFSPELVGAPVSNSEYLLMFNEPDLERRTPEEIAVAWHNAELFYPERKLIGPNVSHLGLEWLFAWRRAYIELYATSPTIWAMGVHCYMTARECEDWTTVNIALAQTWTQSGHVWVTEWAAPPCLYDEDEETGYTTTLAAAGEFMAWLLANPDVEREAWFHARWRDRACNTDLFDGGGMTAFGWWHRAAVGSER